MSNTDSFLEIRFPTARLNDMAGEPFWIDLTPDEARALVAMLQAAPGDASTPAGAAPQKHTLTLR